MKIILLILTLFISSVFAEQPLSYYPLHATGNVENTIFYDSSDIHTNQIVVGKTYQFDKAQIDFTTLTNTSLKLSFSDDTLISIEENTELKLHTYTTKLVNESETPVTVKSDNQNYIFSIMSGVIDVVNVSTNGTFLIQTPRVNITLKTGQYRILVQGKTTVIAVLSGTATIHKVIEGKEIKLESGNFAHVTTYYSLMTKGVDLMNNNKPTASIKKLSVEDVDKIKQSCEELSTLRQSMMFVLVDKKVVGVKIR